MTEGQIILIVLIAYLGLQLAILYGTRNAAFKRRAFPYLIAMPLILMSVWGIATGKPWWTHPMIWIIGGAMCFWNYHQYKFCLNCGRTNFYTLPRDTPPCRRCGAVISRK